MEVITKSQALQPQRDMVRLICKRKKELLVTRSLLIQSSKYFAAIFSGESDWKESSGRAIELDAWPQNDLAAILLCLKTKETKPIFQKMNHYFTAINYFSFTPLMEQCIEFRISNISDETAVDDFEFAERFSIAELRDECLKYLLRRLPEVLRTSRKSRRRMTAELLQKVLRHDKLAVRNEDEVLSLIDIWCSSGKRQSERLKLLQEVRFAHLTQNAFDRCRQDAQCLEVPQFRRLLETPRWSDLIAEFPPERNSNRVHYHVVGFLRTTFEPEREKLLKYDEFAEGVVVHCSETGTLSTAHGAFSENYAKSMIDHLRSVMYGNELYVMQRAGRLKCRLARGSVEIFDGFQHFSDFHDSEPTSTIRFPKLLCTVAPPVVFENDLYLVHMLYKKDPILSGRSYSVNPEDFYGLEITRYRRGKARHRRLQVPVKYDSLDYFLTSGANKLFVNDKWTILLLPSQGVLLVIDSPHLVGPIIKIPEKYWKIENPHTFKSRPFSDLVIVGNVAYVLMKFYVYKEIWHPGDQDWFVPGEKPAGSLTAYDLTEGKRLPDHFVDLEIIYSEKQRWGGFFEESFEFSLKLIQKEVFLIVISSRVEPRESGFPVAAVNYVYRLQRDADGLKLSPASDSAAAKVDRELKHSEYSHHWWGGYRLNIDAHPCEYATALQHKASREEDPIEREKLRRFIW